MNDDEKDKSFERLDESRPERNERSFFDWLRGKEETEESDEEKLRKKLDEELKEAARQRATEFEEERRQEEAREVAETKKLKKRWRKKLVEKSRVLLEQTATQGNNPSSGYDIARVMVAERIVQYHDVLEDETLDLRRSEIKDLKLKIDFMGLLSEKLDRPQLEVPDEIEQLYQTIANSVEEATGERLERRSEPAPTPETQPVSEEDVAYAAFAANIVSVIKRALLAEKTQPADTQGDNTEADDTMRPTTPIAPERSSEPEPRGDSMFERIRATIRKTAPASSQIRQEISEGHTPHKLSEIIERVTLAETTQPHKPAAIAIAGLVRREITPETEHRRPSEEFYIPPNRKIKHMTEVELVALAKLVDVGSGQRLADIYIHGDIDREGMIKVLESYHKGWDYRSEFSFRREQWQHRKEASPEYVTPTFDYASFRTHRPARNADRTRTGSARPRNFLPHRPPTPQAIQRLMTRTKGSLRNIGRAIPSREQAKEMLKHAATYRMRRDYIMVTLLVLLVLAFLLLLMLVIDSR